MPKVDLTDSDLDGHVQEWREKLADRRTEVIDALRAVEAVIPGDVEAVFRHVDGALPLACYSTVTSLRAAQQRYDEALADLAAWTRERDRRFLTRDLQGSASRQHYIDTGNYLPGGA